MTNPDLRLQLLRDPRLAPHVLSPMPVWVFGTTPPCMVWTNAAGATLFGATDVAALMGRAIASSDPLAAELARLGATLPRADAPRLERLRGLGEAIGRRLTCACSWFAIDGTSALLIVGTESVGQPLPVIDRIRRLLIGLDAPLAVFGPTGTLLHASAAAAAHLGGAGTLAALGAAPLGAQARRAGVARGTAAAGPIRSSGSALRARCLCALKRLTCGRSLTAGRGQAGPRLLHAKAPSPPPTRKLLG